MKYCRKINDIYCTKPPQSAEVYFICFIFQGQRSQGLTGLAMAPCGHREGQLSLESPFRIVESG